MKKLKLDLQSFEGAELLTREQLKKVTGGGEEPPAPSPCDCDSDADCGTGQQCGGVCDIEGGYLARCIKKWD